MSARVERRTHFGDARNKSTEFISLRQSRSGPAKNTGTQSTQRSTRQGAKRKTTNLTEGTYQLTRPAQGPPESVAFCVTKRQHTRGRKGKRQRGKISLDLARRDGCVCFAHQPPRRVNMMFVEPFVTRSSVPLDGCTKYCGVPNVLGKHGASAAAITPESAT